MFINNIHIHTQSELEVLSSRYSAAVEHNLHVKKQMEGLTWARDATLDAIQAIVKVQYRVANISIYIYSSSYALVML